MRFFRWLELDDNGDPLELTTTDAEILENYYPYWCDCMLRVGKSHLIDTATCIEDFCVVHWAWELLPTIEASEAREETPSDG